MDDRIKRLKAINELNASKATEDKRYQNIQLGFVETQKTILEAFKSLVDYLDNKITKTQVVNHLKSINTPDALKVIPEIQSLHETLKTHENTDLTEVTKVMKEILTEAKQIPKSQQDIDIPDSVIVSNLPDHKQDFKALLEAIKAIKLVAEAPLVKVDKPDLEPLRIAFKNAIGGINIPKPQSSYLKNGKPTGVELMNDAVPTHQINTLVTEKYDEYKIIYDDFDDDNNMPLASVFYYKGKKVAKVTYSYDKKQRIKGAKKT